MNRPACPACPSGPTGWNVNSECFSNEFRPGIECSIGRTWEVLLGDGRHFEATP